ncbi:entry exclusion lipoprotein TrbK [Pseudomonas sp. BMS12]|uniref:entry exclusion lipoprotein TrbK n=1 Tax=Pseudomonas sp. BMS12 TaxID=1796033 RepID=UPI0009ED672F|nr:entry exclusion lipoprotein TrbK [Pseudomonas sp. BMS12]
MHPQALTLSAVIILTASLTGCLDEKPPEPTAENCSPGTYEKHLAALSNDSSRDEFTVACKGYLKAQKMTEWKFKKSPEDAY